MERINQAPGQYRGVVFKHAPPTADFSCSTEIVLPGEHTKEHAWQAVYAVLEGPDGPEYIGGDVRPC
jgi:hypothetical protein